MRKLNTFIYYISAAIIMLLTACDNESPQVPTSPAGTLLITLAPQAFVGNGISSSIPGEELTESINAYLLENGQLTQCFTNLPTTCQIPFLAHLQLFPSYLVYHLNVCML